MMQRINNFVEKLIRASRGKESGQTALILILVAAAGLIFMAINMNWGRIAQTKSLLTIAADQSAALLASDAASYGEMEKQTWLGNVNRKSHIDWKIVIGIIIIVIAIVITICSWGSTATIMGVVIAAVIVEVVLVIAIVMAVLSLVLQLCVVNPMMENMWNSMQNNQPPQQQFFEQGLGSAIMSSVTDQTSITDYFDLNTNGIFGYSQQSRAPADTINRFGFFYTERLKMLNKGDIPQVVFFYNSLQEFMNGTTCAQNYVDSGLSLNSQTGVPVNPSCLDPNSGLERADYCKMDPADPACQMKIPDTITCAQNKSDLPRKS